MVFRQKLKNVFNHIKYNYDNDKSNLIRET